MVFKVMRFNLNKHTFMYMHTSKYNIFEYTEKQKIKQHNFIRYRQVYTKHIQVLQQ